MIHSIYTHQEIFLREILSNASDAIDKLAYLALTDEKGDSLLNEYAVSTRRIGASLRDEFRVYLPADNTARELRVELVFGVNDNLSSRFDAPASYLLTIPMYAD